MLQVSGTQELVARALGAILDYITARRNDSACLSLVRNVITLAKRCMLNLSGRRNGLSRG